MPRRQPFTALCRTLNTPPSSGRADLHVHSTHSDGLYSPTQVVELARRSGLSALALTDHDTLSGFGEAHAAAGDALEIIPAVEITCTFRERELHLLAFFVSPEDPSLLKALQRIEDGRRARFLEMVERVRGRGVSVDGQAVKDAVQARSLGRRNLAELLVRQQQVGSVREAFVRYLGGREVGDVPKPRLPVAEALALVVGAGGVAGWAHPSYDCTRETLGELAASGLGAVESDYPSMTPSRTRQLRELAASLGLAVCGGSDCHGPEPPRRAIGACTISANEVAALRRLSR